MNTKMDGVARIAAERERQKAVEGWTPEHDAEHNDGEIARAAACYAAGEPIFYAVRRMGAGYVPFTAYQPAWPWADEWWKPKDRIRDLERAGALIAAEIDRILAQDAALTGAEGVDNG